MAPLKFRARHNKEERTGWVTGLSFQADGLLMVGVKWDDGTMGVYGPDEVTVMQFTGMRDQGGTEIYEGDTVVWNGERRYCGYFRSGFGLSRDGRKSLSMTWGTYVDFIKSVEPERPQPQLSEKPTLFDPIESEQAKSQGMSEVEKNADKAWMERALSVVRELSLRMSEFNSDDVTEEMAKHPERTPEGRAMGAVFRKAANLGWIVKTGTYQNSRNPHNHHCPRAIWTASSNQR